MKRVLDLELEIDTDVSPLELASKIEQAVREALEAMRQSFDVELEFDIFLVLDGREVRFVMEPV
jgi:regulator of sirC expression with transglutaminase-like and TPR domain